MATIEDVKALLLRGLDPRNTVNQLAAMLKDAPAPATEPAGEPDAAETTEETKTTKKTRRGKK